MKQPATGVRRQSEEPEKLPTGLFLPDDSIPHLLNVVANRVSATLEHMYGDLFGLTVPGWRVLAILGKRTAPLSAKTISNLTAMDQVSVSRAVEQRYS